MPVPARTIGDHLAENICLLGLLAATCGKIGREIYTLMKTEFGEVEEPVPPGTVGSTTMPQKRNPKAGRRRHRGVHRRRARAGSRLRQQVGSGHRFAAGIPAGHR